MKKGIILKHGGGELANQLWNYISVYAYGLETGTKVTNPSFFEYHPYFTLLKAEGVLGKAFAFWFRDYSGRRSSLRSRFFRGAYALIAKAIVALNKKSIVSSENTNNERTYLPPTTAIALPETAYFIGWLFRNPIGIEKHRENLRQAFAPNKTVVEKIDRIIGDLRKRHEKVIGIHIRQGDYKNFKGGKYLISQERVRKIVSEYAHENTLDAAKTCFVIASDGPVDLTLWNRLSVYVSKENAVTDLFLLSRTDAILGSDSSFGAFASWYGNIPHIVFKNESMDWEYYRDKKRYFENKYSTLVQY